MKERWSHAKYGIQIQQEDIEFMTNIRFADDVLLFADDKQQLQEMMVALQSMVCICIQKKQKNNECTSDRK